MTIPWHRKYTSPPWAVVALTLVAGACGTRAGNPKKPDPEKPGQVVLLPLIDFVVPEATTGSGGLMLFPFKADTSDTPNASSAAASFDGSNLRARVVVSSLNSLFTGLNAMEPALGETLVQHAAQGDVVGKVEQDAATDTTYHGTFCFGGAPFLTVTWSKDGTHIEAVRDLSVNPYGTKDDADAIGRDLLGEALYDAAGATPFLESRLDGTPAVADPLGGDEATLVDFTRIAVVPGGGFVTRAVADWRAAGEKLLPDLRTAGAIEASGSRKILAHHSGLPRLCPAKFDENNAVSPGWCAGVEMVPGAAARLLPVAERNNVWSEIGAAAGLPKSTDLRTVGFASGATCPSVDP